MSFDFENITACGENCIACLKRRNGLCQGCRESDGRCLEWKESGFCPIHSCAREHSVLFCGLCGDFPCGLLKKTIVWRKNVVSELAALAEVYRKQNG